MRALTIVMLACSTLVGGQVYAGPQACQLAPATPAEGELATEPSAPTSVLCGIDRPWVLDDDMGARLLVWGAPTMVLPPTLSNSLPPALVEAAPRPVLGLERITIGQYMIPRSLDATFTTTVVY